MDFSLVCHKAIGYLNYRRFIPCIESIIAFATKYEITLDYSDPRIKQALQTSIRNNEYKGNHYQLLRNIASLEEKGIMQEFSSSDVAVRNFFQKNLTKIFLKRKKRYVKEFCNLARKHSIDIDLEQAYKDALEKWSNNARKMIEKIK